MTRARVVRLLALAAALAIMIVLVARLGPTQIVDELQHVGANAAWLLVVYVAGTAIGALPYLVLFPPHERPTVRSALLGRFAASGINVILPLFGMGGEPTRLLWLPTSERTRGIAVIIVDRLTYAAASALFLLGGVLAAVQLSDLPSSYVIGGLVGAGALLAIAFAAIYVASRHGIGHRLHRLIVRIRKRSAPAGTGTGAAIDREIEAIVLRRRPLLAAVLIGLLARSVLGLEIVVAYAICGAPLSAAEACTVAAVPVLLTFVGAVVPGQLGLQEGSQALIARTMGIDPSTAVAAVLLTRVRQLVTAGIAWAMVARKRI